MSTAEKSFSESKSTASVESSPGLFSEPGGRLSSRQMVSAIMTDRVTVRELKDFRLRPLEPLAPEKIKQIRESFHVSQAVFAQLINTSVSTVQKWEIGSKRPTGTALKLLHLIQDRGLSAITDASF